LCNCLRGHQPCVRLLERRGATNRFLAGHLMAMPRGQAIRRPDDPPERGEDDIYSALATAWRRRSAFPRKRPQRRERDALGPRCRFRGEETDAGSSPNRPGYYSTPSALRMPQTAAVQMMPAQRRRDALRSASSFVTQSTFGVGSCHGSKSL